MARGIIDEGSVILHYLNKDIQKLEEPGKANRVAKEGQEEGKKSMRGESNKRPRVSRQNNEY